MSQPAPPVQSELSRQWCGLHHLFPDPMAFAPHVWMNSSLAGSASILCAASIQAICASTSHRYEFWDIDGVGKRLLAQWLVSVVITVAARIRAGVMQLRHRRAEQRLGLGLNRLVEPCIQRSRKLASHHNRRIKLNSRIATKSFKEDGRGRAAEPLLDRGERLVEAGALG